MVSGGSRRQAASLAVRRRDPQGSLPGQSPPPGLLIPSPAICRADGETEDWNRKGPAPTTTGCISDTVLLCCLGPLTCQQRLSKSPKCFNMSSFTWARGWHRSSVQGRWGQRPGGPAGGQGSGCRGHVSHSFGRIFTFSFSFLCEERVIQFFQGSLLDAFVTDKNLLQATCMKETPCCPFSSIRESGSECLHLGELAPPWAI